MDATISCSYRPPVATVRIAGELDILSRGPLAWRLIDLDAIDCSMVCLDLGGVTQIDAGSLRLLEEARRRIASRGAAFRLTSASPYLELVCRIAGYAVLAAEARRLERVGRGTAADVLPFGGRPTGARGN